MVRKLNRIANSIAPIGFANFIANSYYFLNQIRKLSPMNKFNAETRTNLTVIASNNLNEGVFQTNQHGIEATSSHYYSVSTR